MPISKVQGKITIAVDQLDGGLNTKDAANKIGDYDSPDCLNVIFSNEGAVQTRSGTTYLGAAVNTSSIDGMLTYNGTAAIFAGGHMYRLSSTTWAEVTTASGKFATGANVESVTYQGVSFMSDGTNGPYRWEGGENFYMMGVGIPTAPTGVSNVATASSQGIVTGNTVYYKVAFVNSHVVTGQPGSMSLGVTPGTTANINVSGIPLGSGLFGVSSRKIYRSTATNGIFGLVKTLSDNTASTFTDTVPVGSEGSAAVTDGTAPTPWTTVREFKETIFFDDSSNKSLLRFTDYQNPYISSAANFFSTENNKGEDIGAIGVQDNFLTVFYKKSKIWVYDLVTPSTASTWTRALSPSNLGIVGPRAFAEIPDGIVFMGMQNGKISGIHQISGVNVNQIADHALRSEDIGGKIDPTLFAMPASLLSKVAMTSYQNKLYIAVPQSSISTTIDGMLYFDNLRLTTNGESPGSWAPWTGIKVQALLNHNGTLYGGSSQGDGRVIEFNSGAYVNADGSAINSYWWSKELGGEGDLAYWTKDGRWTDIWHALVGTYNMKYRFRKDGDSGNGTSYSVNLTQGGSIYGSFNWGDGSLYGSGNQTKQSRVYIGPVLGKRFQHGFTNENTVNQYFKVFNFQSTINLRSQKRGT